MDIDLPAECISAICTPGPNDLAVAQWVDQLSFVKLFTLKECKEFVKEYIWDKDFKRMKKKDWYEYALWIHAWNEFELQGSQEGE